ncbi:MAG: DUF5050 domain-containing protein [Clostridia bacterium]|nr:DUF5050 domain-containing protein [Clostridia bacterium]
MPSQVPSSSPMPSDTPSATSIQTATPTMTVSPTSTPSPTTSAEIKKIIIEDYTGKNIKEVKIDGITIKTSYVLNKTVAKDIVVSQNVNPGTELEKGQEITFEVSMGQVSLTYGYDLTTLFVPREYSYNSYYFSINPYDNNVFLRSISGIVVKNVLIIYGCESMYFDNNGTIYFKKLSNGNIYSYNLSKRQETLLINEKCNDYILVDGKIFYSTDSKVAEYQLSSKSSKTLINQKAKRFQVYNDKVYILTNNDGSSKIQEVDINTGNKKDISSVNVRSFLINQFKVFYYKDNILVYFDLYDGKEYTATSEQKNSLSF